MGVAPHMLNLTLSSEELTEYIVYKAVRCTAYLKLPLRHKIFLTECGNCLQETQLFSPDPLDGFSVFSNKGFKHMNASLALK